MYYYKVVEVLFSQSKQRTYCVLQSVRYLETILISEMCDLFPSPQE